MKAQITWDDFEKLDIRIGTIISAVVFEEAIRPAYRLEIDFGELGIRKSSAQITTLYRVESLPGRQVAAIVNFPEKQIANMKSQCLVLGVVSGKDVTLLTPDKPVDNGLKIG